jgi:ribosomal protein L37AE/L43A
MKDTQIEWVKSQLRKNGKISRNECLRNYISRLGAIIWKLKQHGWKIEGSLPEDFNPLKHHYGDYVYRLIKEPL